MARSPCTFPKELQMVAKKSTTSANTATQIIKNLHLDMAGLPAGAPGCMQWTMLKLEHAEMLHSYLQSLMSDIGECPECPPLNMFDMYKTEFPGCR